MKELLKTYLRHMNGERWGLTGAARAIRDLGAFGSVAILSLVLTTSAFADAGFLYSGGKFTSITVPGASDTWAYGINNSGQIVGSYDGDSHGFLLSGNTYSKIDYPGAYVTVASSINNMGQIVGYYYSHSTSFSPHGFLLSGGTYSNIDFPGEFNTYPYGLYTYPFGINDSGQIVGTVVAAAPELNNFLLFGTGIAGLAGALLRKLTL